MKITIEIDPVTAAAQVTGPVIAQGDSPSQAAAKTTQGAALSAGAFEGITPESITPALAPRRTTPPDSLTGSAPPSPHPDNFGLPFGENQSVGVFDAGPPRS